MQIKRLKQKMRQQELKSLWAGWCRWEKNSCIWRKAAGRAVGWGPWDPAGSKGWMLRVANPVLWFAGYLAAQAAASRGPLLYPGALSEGQFYSPPESFAGRTSSPCFPRVFPSRRFSWGCSAT